MAALTYFAPDFIREGRLCWLRSPLHIVRIGNIEQYYYSDEEYAKATITGSAKVKRCKGLGTLSPDEARRSMFTPEFQRMDVMEYSDDAIELLYKLMGEDVEPRRDFIMKNVDFAEIRE